MLYLITGANGTFKTCNTLKMVHDLAVKEGRPVAHNGRFRINPDGPLAAWKRIDFKDWQSEPDGTIFFIDECHNDLPVRPGTQAPPEHVRMLAEHRARGFDFFLLTQHPGNIDNFVRRLIGNPGFHRHMKRVAGAELASQLQWDTVNLQCEKEGAGRTGQVTMVGAAKEAYSWYYSATLHTAKKKIPRAVWVLAACVVLVPLLGWYGVRMVTSNLTGRGETISSKGEPGAAAVPGASGGGGGASRMAVQSGPMTAAQYAEVRQPRFAGLPHTAPAYDQVTAPVVAPYPAACVEGVRPGTSGRVCSCWSQQGTVLPMPADVCGQIVRHGFFVDWKQPEPVERLPQLAAMPPVAAVEASGQVVAAQAVPVVMEVPAEPMRAAARPSQSVVQPSAPPAAGPAPAAGGVAIRR